MSELAKKARAAMKAKAQRLGKDRPLEKVDSSTFVPPEMLNADVKTGLRPVSRRAYKKGGKVMGEACDARADRKQRKAGGATGKQIAEAKINRNVKDANELREGKKHIGGMKKGGRAKYATDGEVKDYSVTGSGTLTRGGKDVVGPSTMKATEERKAPPIPQRPQREPEKGMSGEEASEFMKGRKAGGRAKKADGGADVYGPGVAGAADMMKKAGARAGVPGGLYGAGFNRLQKGALSPLKAAGMKKGGEAHSDEKMDIALIKKMVKPEARKGRATGGNVFSGPSYPGKIPGVVPGGRTAKAAGGKTKGKGKTNINIVIAAGKPAQQGDMTGQPPGGIPTDNRGPGGIPVPVSQPPGGAAGMPGGGMPIPMPMPMPAGGPPAPQGGMPMGRKTGGRVTKVAKSYKDMEAGAGGGEGRLQKTDIAKTGKGAPTFKRGGKVYRSYKDMDAGAGSGVGRLEKTEIQSRKK